MNPLIQLHDAISPLVERYSKYIVYALAFICGTALIPCITDLIVGFFLGQVNTTLIP